MVFLGAFYIHFILENSPEKKTRADWLKIVLSTTRLDRDAELARSVDVKAVFLFLVATFSKVNRKHVVRVSMQL